MRKALKRIPRNPERFESIDLFTAYCSKRGLKLKDTSTKESFLETLSKSLAQSKTNPILIHGRRIESMFGYVVASLGKCEAIKHEDKGDIYAIDTNIRPPDYRIVLDDGYEFLVEVKNHYPRDPKAPYQFRESDLQALLNYAQVFNRDLKIAIYWSPWNIWTLTAPDKFESDSSRSLIELPQAVRLNEFSLLGDQMIATTPPLLMRLKPDLNKSVVCTDSRIDFTIGAIEFHCGSTLVEDKSEQNLSFYFMLFGRWPVNDPQPQIKNGQLESVDIVAAPDTPLTNQPFQFLGDLSGMISRYYDFLTASEHGVKQVTPSCEPGTLGAVIPSKCTYLRLWRFTLHPDQERYASKLGG